jgi:hypothetical protein
MNFAQNKSLEAYNGFADVVGKRYHPNSAILFNRTAFQQGYTIFAANLAPSGVGRGSLGLIKEGNLSISLSFETVLPNTVMVLSLLLFDTMIEINNFRQLITDFAG